MRGPIRPNGHLERSSRQIESTQDRLNKNMLVSFEGSVCAGKTTLANRLAHEEHILAIPEYMSLLVGPRRKMFSGMTPEGKLACLLEIELERNPMVSESSAPTVLDRSVLSLYAFEYAMKSINAHYSNPRLPSSLKGRPYRLPDKIIFFDVGEPIRRARSRQRGGDMSDLLLQQHFNQYNLEFFQHVSAAIPTVFIDTSDGEFDSVYKTVALEVMQAQRNREDAYPVLRSLFGKW